MDLRSNEIVLEFGHDWVNIVNIRLWLRLIYSICHDSTVTYFFSVHACNKMTHSSCNKWHSLFFWHAFDAKNDSLRCLTCSWHKKRHTLFLWHNPDAQNDTLCSLAYSWHKKWHHLFFQCRRYIIWLIGHLLFQIAVHVRKLNDLSWQLDCCIHMLWH